MDPPVVEEAAVDKTGERVKVRLCGQYRLEGFAFDGVADCPCELRGFDLVFDQIILRAMPGSLQREGIVVYAGQHQEPT